MAIMFRNSCAVIVETCHLCCFSVFVIGGSKISQALQKIVCEIPVCPLHISRTHLLSINSSQLCVAKQITKGTLVSLLLRMSHITPHIPPVNVGISYTLQIMLMHLWTKSQRRILYRLYQERKCMFCSRMYGNHYVGILQLWCCSFELKLRNCSLVALLMSSTDSNHAQKLLFHLSKHSIITQESLGNKAWKNLENCVVIAVLH